MLRTSRRIGTRGRRLRAHCSVAHVVESAHGDPDRLFAVVEGHGLYWWHCKGRLLWREVLRELSELSDAFRWGSRLHVIVTATAQKR
ncbi:hypothetical protein OE88DRAFT_1487567 [Heliocybe sulcata]|uniref:Uncharacterized protein n=1 Tax=Heliocybe sulcata TaxID=5364 RepID=A0A5C3N4L6_9AGAM|nr:hypothetical protein OE88DRAFT_1487567 [Heliocybe sulcata]